MSQTLLLPDVLKKIGRLDLIARTVVEGYLMGLHRSPYKGLSQEFASHRPYMIGDEVRHIDWKLYGRTDRLYVKEFEEETNAPVRLLLDASNSLAFAPDTISKFDYARYLLASLAYIGVRQNDRVSLTVFDSAVNTRLPAKGSRRHLQSILVALEQSAPSGTTDLAGVLETEALLWKRRGIVILVTDLYDGPRRTVDALVRIRRSGNHVIVIQLSSTAEKSFNYNGTWEFEDLETGQRIILQGKEARNAHLDGVKQRSQFFHREFRGAGIEYVEFNTSEPLDHALSLYLKARGSGESR